MPSVIPDPGTVALGVEYPPRADLRKDVQKSLPKVPPGIIDKESMTSDRVAAEAQAVLDAINLALDSKDAGSLAGLFYVEQAFWRDIAALTSHWRTFSTPSVAAAAFVKMTAARQLDGMIKLAGSPQLVVVNPVLMFIQCIISFQTRSPALGCEGRMLLLPVKIDGEHSPVSWKIWFLTTWTEILLNYPEDESRLSAPSKQLDGLETLETDVFIIGFHIPPIATLLQFL
ncbi:hypothetical protein F5X98DRAFT_386666 [Xylaria grammica]|nr:hypothetical protein F5X98DRAFT_386666 [Xylaria grammica]